MSKKKKNKNTRHKLLRIFTICATIIMLILAASVMIGALWVDKNFDKEVSISEYSLSKIDTETKLFYYNFSDRKNRIGEVMQYNEKIYNGQNSLIVEYEDLPDNLINAFLSIEDKRFNTHGGVDYKRTLGAIINYLLGSEKSFGGSTITQQVVKNITGNNEYSVERKIQEIIYAVDLERKLTKPQILELYLNIVNMAHGCYGVGTAADYYFSKKTCELSLVECASLAAITSSPANYEPLNNYESNHRRRNMILDLMLEQGYINKEEHDAACEEELNIIVNSENYVAKTNSWYVDMAVNDIVTDLMEKYNYTYEYANHLIYNGGLKIYLAVDPEIQANLESYYKDNSNFPVHNDGTTAQSAAIVIDSQTGDILGVVGARGEKSGNRVLCHATKSLHSTGSVIKPLSVYAPSLEKNLITYASVYDDTPVKFLGSEASISEGTAAKPTAWPSNANNIYKGLTNINYALKYSTNTVAVKVLRDLGVNNSFDFLYSKLHIKSLIDRKETPDGNIISDKQEIALALGQMNYGITLREITSAYSIFAANGCYNGSRSYYRVCDRDGNILLSDDSVPEKVIGSDTACIMTKLLQNVAKTGTAHNITLDSFIDCAAKTGTTQNDCDKWTIGYTPYYICGVWYGYEYPRELTGLIKNPCVNIWDDIMISAHQRYINSDEKPRGFVMDPNVVSAVYCVDSGKLLTNACEADPRGDRSQLGYFKKGTEPSNICDCHILVKYDTLHGGVASYTCPLENISYVGMLNIKRSFPIQLYITDAQYVYRSVPDFLMSSESAKPFFSAMLNANEYCGISSADYQFNRGCPYCSGKRPFHSDDSTKDGQNDDDDKEHNNPTDE